MPASVDEEDLKGLPKAGDVLAGRYAIEGVLGAGGMGVVLSARHVTLGQRVAVKFLLPDVAKRLPDAAERFLREARAAIHLKSEHVAKVMDVGTEPNGAAYMVMEFLEGQDLQKASQQGTPLGITWVVDCVLQATEALAEAHVAGVVHRDLKPANLFLTTRADGSPLIKVLDFGISKANTSGERGITRTDAVMGSPGYMAPEQIRSAKHVDQRADIWGLGIVLYELLSGRPPFDGDNIAALSAQIVLETPPSLVSLRPEVPPGLAAAVEHCLEKEPGKRFANVGELAEALAPFATPAGAAIAARVGRIARPVSAYAETMSLGSSGVAGAGTVGNFERSNVAGKRRAALFAGAAILAVAGLVIAFLAGQRASEPVTAEPPARETAAAANPAPSAPASAVPAPTPSSAVPTDLKAEVPAPAPKQAASPLEIPDTERKRPRAPRTPACPRGQVSSRGHCCPVGLVWLDGRCDRPLATLP